MNNIITLKRVSYGSNNTPVEDREYTIVDGNGSVGTLKEFEDAFPDNECVVVEGGEEQ